MHDPLSVPPSTTIPSTILPKLSLYLRSLFYCIAVLLHHRLGFDVRQPQRDTQDIIVPDEATARRLGPLLRIHRKHLKQLDILPPDDKLTPSVGYVIDACSNFVQFSWDTEQNQLITEVRVSPRCSQTASTPPVSLSVAENYLDILCYAPQHGDPPAVSSIPWVDKLVLRTYGTTGYEQKEAEWDDMVHHLDFILNNPPPFSNLEKVDLRGDSWRWQEQPELRRFEGSVEQKGIVSRYV